MANKTVPLKSKAHLDRVGALECCVCGGRIGGKQIHHLKGNGLSGMGQKAGDFFTIPLCQDHHTGANGFHTIGQKTWEMIHGTQISHLEKTLEILFNV